MRQYYFFLYLVTFICFSLCGGEGTTRPRAGSITYKKPTLERINFARKTVELFILSDFKTDMMQIFDLYSQLKKPYCLDVLSRALNVDFVRTTNVDFVRTTNVNKSPVCLCPYCSTMLFNVQKSRILQGDIDQEITDGMHVTLTFNIPWLKDKLENMGSTEARAVTLKNL